MKNTRPLWTLAAVLTLPALALAGRPKWVDHKDATAGFDPAKYLMAVGFGPSRTAAENSATANMSKIFESSVDSVSQDYMAAFSNGKEALEVQNVETLTKVSTQGTLNGVKIQETWDDTQGTLYALALLEREPAARTAKERLLELDSEIDAHLGRVADTSDKVKKLTSLRKAAKAMQERMARNAQLRILSSDGKGVDAKHSAADIVAQLENVADMFVIGVIADGEASDDLGQALSEGLTESGFSVQAIADEEEMASFDLVVRGNCRIEDATGRSSRFNLSRVVVKVELVNPQANRIIKAFSESRKEGAGSQDEAASRAIRKMQSQLVAKIKQVIDQKFGPK